MIFVVVFMFLLSGSEQFMSRAISNFAIEFGEDGVEIMASVWTFRPSQNRSKKLSH